MRNKPHRKQNVIKAVYYGEKNIYSIKFLAYRRYLSLRLNCCYYYYYFDDVSADAAMILMIMMIYNQNGLCIVVYGELVLLVLPV